MESPEIPAADTFEFMCVFAVNPQRLFVFSWLYKLGTSSLLLYHCARIAALTVSLHLTPTHHKV